jgi:hypothetical protein
MMKWFGLLFLVVVPAVLAQNKGTMILSDPFVLKPKYDIKPPVLRLLEPVPDATGMITIMENVLRIKGTAVDESGIRTIEANGLTIIPSTDGGFVLKVPLDEGWNRITLRVVDNADNDTTTAFNVLSDTKPPVISLIEPQGEQTRGAQIVAVATHTIRGKVYDESGIREVDVNRVPIPIGTDSIFSAELPPGTGTQDTVSIVAFDNTGRRTEKVLLLSQSAIASGPSFLKFKSYALIIGIDTYKGKWPPLENAVKDAKAVAAELRTGFRFEKVDTLFNQDATRDNILSTLENLAKKIGPDDNLLVYFSGHGRKEPPLNRGYWVPVDATEKSVGRYISNREIQDYLASMNARHVLLVADACFAGDIFKGKTEQYEFEDNEAYYKKVAERKSRSGLTSGGDEPVLDGGGNGHSVFATYLLKALGGIKKQYFSAEEVYQELKIPVANNSDQTPTFLPIKNTDDAGGQFIFVRR